MIATNGNRERMREEVVEILGVVLPPGAGVHDDLPAVTTSVTDASNLIGTRFQRTPGREDLDAPTRAQRDPPRDPTLGTEEGVPRVHGPGPVPRLQLETIARLCQERDQLRQKLAEARAALLVMVDADRDHLERLEACVAQLEHECEQLHQEGEVLREQRGRLEAAVEAQAARITIAQFMKSDY